MMPAHALIVVSAIRLLVGDALSGVLNNLLTRSYALCGKNPASLNFRAPNLVQSVGGVSVVT